MAPPFEDFLNSKNNVVRFSDGKITESGLLATNDGDNFSRRVSRKN